MTDPAIRNYTFHLVNGEAIEVKAYPDEVAFDGDYLAFDLVGEREVIIARRHITHIQVRDVE